MCGLALVRHEPLARYVKLRELRVAHGIMLYYDCGLRMESCCKCKQDSVGVQRILVVPRDSGGASTGFCWCVLGDKRSGYLKTPICLVRFCGDVITDRGINILSRVCICGNVITDGLLIRVCQKCWYIFCGRSVLKRVRNVTAFGCSVWEVVLGEWHLGDGSWHTILVLCYIMFICNSHYTANVGYHIALALWFPPAYGGINVSRKTVVTGMASWWSIHDA